MLCSYIGSIKIYRQWAIIYKRLCIVSGSKFGTLEQDRQIFSSCKVFQFHNLHCSMYKGHLKLFHAIIELFFSEQLTTMLTEGHKGSIHVINFFLTTTLIPEPYLVVLLW